MTLEAVENVKCLECDPRRGPKARYLPAILDVLRDQQGVLTARQLFYRLVSKGIIRNALSNYIRLCQVLKQERVKGSIPWNRIVDRSKPVYEGEGYNHCSVGQFFDYYRGKFEGAEKDFCQSWREYGLPLWWKQPSYVEVWTEKDALTGIFEQVTKKYGVPLCVCRGYQSITNIHDAVERIRQIARTTITDPNGKKPIILYFGDYDPRGENIPEIIKQDFNALGCSVTLQKIALTREQITSHRLIPQPCKKSDTMSSKWITVEGDNVWEIDALEPNILVSIIDSAILSHFDKTIYQERNEGIKESHKIIQEKIAEYLADSSEVEPSA